MDQRKLGLTLLIVGGGLQILSSAILPLIELPFVLTSDLLGPILIVAGIVVLVRSNRAESSAVQTPPVVGAVAEVPSDGLQIEDKNEVPTTTRPGCLLGLFGLALAFSPLLIAALSTQPGHNMWSEGDSASGGAAIWLMIFTLPVGGALGLVGLIRFFSQSAKK